MKKLKRTDEEILVEIRNVYAGLSPENLTCDGELPLKQARAEERKLKTRLNRLFYELGREVSEEEAFGLKTGGQR